MAFLVAKTNQIKKRDAMKITNDSALMSLQVLEASAHKLEILLDSRPAESAEKMAMALKHVAAAKACLRQAMKALED